MTTTNDGTGLSWVQLTYTSADAIAGVKGGWGVKQTTPPDAPSWVTSALRDAVTTRIHEVVETSQFASQTELQARTRRLMFKVTGGIPALWHTAAAGLDATGRPGNVYTHAAALVSDDPSMRPIEYWRSSDWLVPFGPAEVTSARLGQLRPGTAITRAKTVAFLREQDRVFNLEWMLAAVSHTSAQSTMLVLICDTADEAAQWLAAISYLTSPRLGRRISWVTFERAERLDDPSLAGLRIVAVPRADLDVIAAPAANTLMVDPRWSLEDPGSGPWRTPMGQIFDPDHNWQSGLIDLFALDDDDQILRILCAADDITASLEETDAATLPLHWALSWAMLTAPGVAVIDRAGLMSECLRVAPPRLQRAAAGSVMADYLQGGWQTAAGHELPESLVPVALDDNQALVTQAIKAAQGSLLGNADQILAAARMLSVLLDHPGAGRGPGEMEVLVAGMRSRLGVADVAGQLDVIAQLNPALSADSVTARTPQADSSSGAAAPRPLPSWDADPVPVSTLEAAASATLEPSTAIEHDREVEPGAETLPSDVDEALALLLVDERPGSARYFGIADSIRVVRGLREVPLWRLPPGGHRAMAETALAQWSDVSNTPLRAVFASWLTVLYALSDAEKLADQPPPALLKEIRERPEPHQAELVRLLATNPEPHMVAQAVAAAIRRACYPLGHSVLSVKFQDGTVLGWRAVTEAVAAMDRTRYDEVMELLEPQIPAVRTSLGSMYDRAYLDQLRAAGAASMRTRVKARRD